jgi:hypothetical protein
MTPGGRLRGGGYNWLAWIDSSIYIYSMFNSTDPSLLAWCIALEAQAQLSTR